MTGFNSANRAQLREAEVAVHSSATSVGVSSVSDYIELRRAQIAEDLLYASDYNQVCRMQAAVAELDLLLRIIRKGPFKKPNE
jgi:hypothetical protein